MIRWTYGASRSGGRRSRVDCRGGGLLSTVVDGGSGVTGSVLALNHQSNHHYSLALPHLSIQHGI